jgi:capsular polysaccharide transport system permease protein
MFYLIRGVLKGGLNGFGTSYFLFLSSGLFPFYLFLRISIRGRRGGSKSNRSARVTWFDEFVAGAAVLMVLWSVITGILFVGMWVYGIEQARPASMADCLSALFFLAALGAGLSLIYSSIGRFFPVFLTIISLSSRGLLFLSGVIHLPAMLTPGVRSWLAWNPVLHGVEWFRVGVYGHYPALLLDRFYLMQCTIIVLFIGFVMERATLQYGGK